jgi:hypothetical protein
VARRQLPRPGLQDRLLHELLRDQPWHDLQGARQRAAYLIAFKDGAGELYSGDKSYRLHLPAPIPAANFWSLTLYDALTASGLDNGQPFPSLNSHDRPAANADGSVDLHVGPTPPPGKQANWLKSVPGKGYFVILRLYGPREAFLSLSWKPSDLEEMK